MVKKRLEALSELLPGHDVAVLVRKVPRLLTTNVSSLAQKVLAVVDRPIEDADVCVCFSSAGARIVNCYLWSGVFVPLVSIRACFCCLVATRLQVVCTTHVSCQSSCHVAERVQRVTVC